MQVLTKAWNPVWSFHLKVQIQLTLKVDGGFGLTKTGAGTLKLSATNTYTGMTTVEEGKLLLTGSLAGDATIASNAVLEAGQGTIDGALTLADGAIIDYSEANGGGITLNGLLTQAGEFTLNLTDEILTTTFDLFDGSGNFADLDLSAATINDVYGLNAGKTLTINGQTVQLGVPEGALENFEIAISDGDVVLSWDGLSTLTYAVESTPTLSIPDWNDVTNNVQGVDGTVSVTTGVSTVTEFYRAYVD